MALHALAVTQAPARDARGCHWQPGTASGITARPRTATASLSGTSAESLAVKFVELKPNPSREFPRIQVIDTSSCTDVQTSKVEL